MSKHHSRSIRDDRSWSESIALLQPSLVWLRGGSIFYLESFKGTELRQQSTESLSPLLNSLRRNFAVYAQREMKFLGHSAAEIIVEFSICIEVIRWLFVALVVPALLFRL